MIVQTRTSDPHYGRYVELLRQLHRLIAKGQGDSAPADAVRDEMDVHAPFLTDIESQRAEGLSAALYSLTGDELYRPEARSNPVRESDIKAAWEGEDYDRVLNLLQHPAPFLAAHEIAFMRAHCWAQLGDLETALLFYQRASDLLPHDEQYTAMLMLTYLGLGRLSDARSCADQLADVATVTMPIILLRAAGVLYASLGESPDASSRSALTQIVDLIDRAFTMDRKLPPESRLDDADRAQYLAVTAVCHIELGRRQDAARACDESLRSDPHNELAKTAKNALSREAPAGTHLLKHTLQSQVGAKESQDQNPIFRDPLVGARG